MVWATERGIGWKEMMERTEQHGMVVWLGALGRKECGRRSYGQLLCGDPEKRFRSYSLLHSHSTERMRVLGRGEMQKYEEKLFCCERNCGRVWRRRRRMWQRRANQEERVLCE